MKKVSKSLLLAFSIAWMMTFAGCQKNIEIPTLTTTAVSDITSASAVTGGSVTASGGAEVTARGVCWGITHNPTVDFAKTSDGTGSGAFSSNISDLAPNTTYYIRAYATNKAGTAYGNEISFTSQDTPAAVTTTAIVSYTSTSAVVTGNVIYGQTGYQLIGSGVCWSTSQNPTTEDNKTINETFSGNFSSNLTGLTQGTTYFVRAYAEYDNGPSIYGNELSFTTSFEPGTGTQKADFLGGARYEAAGFAIGTKVYVGLGTSDGDNILKDFWEWDQASNIWSQIADYPGNSSIRAVGFSIGTKGYIGTGYTNEFWEYDPATNTWAQKSSVPSTFGIAGAVGFSIGTKGYIGTGLLSNGISGSFNQDFWEWDQATNVWTKKADFPGNDRWYAVGFSIGNKGYIGTGSGQAAYKDFWEWDQATDEWTQKADFSGTPRLAAVGFSIGNKGYIGTGINYGTASNFNKDFWEWDQSTNVWIQNANLAGDARFSAVGVSIGNNGYIGTGYGSDSNVLQDFWEYDPTLK